MMDLEKEIEKCKQDLDKVKRTHGQWTIGYYEGVLSTLQALKNSTYGPDDSAPNKSAYPQSPEPNEYRYIDPHWLDIVAESLTEGAKNHPGETWKTIPAAEHAARAMRHINLYRAGDEADDHLVNASMRCMMAYVVDREARAK